VDFNSLVRGKIREALTKAVKLSIVTGIETHSVNVFFLNLLKPSGNFAYDQV
jgi:hypothetical protein